MYAAASGVVTSFSATTRSTSRPTHAELAVALALDDCAGGLRTQQHDALVHGHGTARLVDEPGHRPDERADAVTA